MVNPFKPLIQVSSPICPDRQHPAIRIDLRSAIKLISPTAISDPASKSTRLVKKELGDEEGVWFGWFVCRRIKRDARLQRG